MTIALSYEPDLARVRIDLSGYPDVNVRVERSINQMLWTVVRGGRMLPISGGTAFLFDYEFVDGVENYYRVTPMTGVVGGLVISDDTLGNRAYTVDKPQLKITGDIDIRADVALDNWEGTGDFQWLVTKWNINGQRSYALRLDPGGDLSFAWTEDGESIINVDATVKPQPDENGRLAVRATLDVNTSGGPGEISQYRTTFYTAQTIAGPWTELGTPNAPLGTTSIFDSTADVVVGQGDNVSGEFTGVIYAAEIYDGITVTGTGGRVADPDFESQPAGTTSFDDSHGNTWIIEGQAAIIQIETDSITPDLDGQTWLKSVEYPFLNRPLQCDFWDEIDRPFRGAVFEIQGRSMPVAVTDLRASQRYLLTVTTSTLEEARDFDLVLAASGVLFIHVPLENPGECDRSSAVPGGYVVIDTTRQQRPIAGRSGMRWELPCTIVVPPGPDVVGTTMTWGSVFNLYGDWTALINANPTWRDLLQNVGSPNDLVVL